MSALTERLRLDSWLADRARDVLRIPVTPDGQDPRALFGLDDVDEDVLAELLVPRLNRNGDDR